MPNYIMEHGNALIRNNMQQSASCTFITSRAASAVDTTAVGTVPSRLAEVAVRQWAQLVQVAEDRHLRRARWQV
jgi:hypothetical protein